MQQGPETLNFEQALGVLRRRLLLIVLCVVVVAGAAYAYSKHQTKKYTATASLSFTNNSLSQQVAGLPVASGSSALVQQASNLQLVRLGDMAAKTAARLGDGLTAEKVAKGISIAGNGESSVVSVSATAASGMLAAAIANVYASEFVKEQQRANRQYFTTALTLVHKQLARLSPRQRVGGDGLQLQNRAQTLGLLAELGYGTVNVAQEALAPTSPSSPKTSRNTTLGVLLGLLLGLGLAFALERVDRRLKGPEDLEGIYGLPLLGGVPESVALARSARGDPTALPAPEAEAFNLIRARLRFFNVDRDLRTIVIASPASGDGKSTVAHHLSAAAARLGARVLLLEVDLRRPTIAQRLDIEPGSGLVDVLIGAVAMDEATDSVRLKDTPGDALAARTLDVLTAGSMLPSNPAELLESHAMDVVLHQAKSTYDLVVIDTPPLTAVSDALPLLPKVDGVAIVGRIGRSRRDAAEALYQVLAGSGASLLGVIANGSKSERLRGYASANVKEPRLAVASANGGGPSEHVPVAKV